jgi:GT2 family glycosyltransferase
LGVSVVITTYKRAWALPNVLTSLTRQSVPPDEVVVVLKPSGDGSEDIIREYARKLPIKLVIQEEGNAAGAAELGIKNSNHDYVLFVDDDAVVREDWVERYVKLFSELRDAGGIGGLVYKAFYRGGRIELVDERFYAEEPSRRGPHRRPLPEFTNYCGWVSTSGVVGAKTCSEPVVPSVYLSGVNMGFRREIVKGCPLSTLYKGSRKSFHYEIMLCYYVRRKGFNTYLARDSGIAPIAYHIVGVESLTRGRGFKHEFWLHYDRAMDYWRLKKLGADVKLAHYILAMLIMMRKKPISRALAFIYANITRSYLLHLATNEKT